jgi:hypothetical protein
MKIMENITRLFLVNKRFAAFKTFISCAFFLVGFSIDLNAQTNSTFTSNGTFTVPAGVTNVQVQAWGGGGGGGGVNGSNTQTRAGGGGSGGTFTLNPSVAVNPLSGTITVTVGQGGTAGTNNADGGNGGTSTFASATPVTAVGGNGGATGDGSPQYGSGGAFRVGVTYDGGAGAAASGGNSGGGGGGAGSSGDGGNATGTSAGAAGAGGGGAGAAGRTNNGDGISATALGGGGSGGRSSNNTDRNGGSGFRGQVVVTYTCPTYALSVNPTSNSVCTSDGSTAVITLTGTTTSLPVGVYTVTYSRSLPNASGLTATMTVSAAGTGNFTAVGLTSPGNVTITITNLASGGCSTAVSAFNTVVIPVSASATANSGSSISVCYASGSIAVSGGSSATNYSSILWTTNGSGALANETSLTLCEYTPSEADLLSGSVTLTLTAFGVSPCGNISSSKVLNLFSLPTATGVSLCQGGSGNLTAGVLGGSLTIQGTWTSTPVAARPDTGTNSATCDFTYTGGPYSRNYVATPFKVSVTGSYTFTMTQNNNYDGMGYIVTGNFVPGSCATGTFIRRDDDDGPDDEPRIITNLTAGVTYTLISTTYATSSGVYLGSFEWNVIPPSGGQLLPVVEWYVASVGGTSIGQGTSFNPVGIAGSGLTNTNTAGVTAFYTGNSLNQGCGRTAVSFEVLTNITYYADADGDGFGDAAVSQVSCTGAPVISGNTAVTNNTDCDDNDQTKNASFPFYADNDNDGFGSGNLINVCAVNALSPPSGYVLNNTDCDDQNTAINTTFSFYEDLDGDGVGYGNLVSGVCALDAGTPPTGFSLSNTDCSPNDINTYREGVFYTDADGDNYSVTNNTVVLCYGTAEPDGYSLQNFGSDCNDNLAAVNSGQTEILYNGFDDDCSGTIDDGHQITAAMVNCGTTLSTISSLIYCISTPGANGYRFEITNTATNQVQTIDKPAQFFSLTELASYDYATTYSVRVMLRKSSNNVWLGYYGPACMYSTPPVISQSGGAGTTQLQNYCGQIIPTVSTIIATTSLPGATGYRFRVTNTITGTVQTLTRTLHWFSMTMFGSFNYGTTYAVDVAVKTTGDFSDYGAPCYVSTPAVPSLTNYCGGALVPTKGTSIKTASLDKLTAYEFTVDRYNNDLELISSSVVVKTLNRFTFNDITNYYPNTNYHVRVRVFSSGSWSPYSDACEIVSPGADKQGDVKFITEDYFAVQAYPNPFGYQFSFRMESSSEAPVTIKVFDMVGKLIETREVIAADMPVIALGERYSSGVYNVVVTQGDNVKTLRLVKR